MILTDTNDTLEAFLGEAIATSQPTYIIKYIDIETTSFGMNGAGHSAGSLNGTSDVTVVAAPSSGVHRHVKSIIICNVDTITHTVTVQLDDDGTEIPAVSATQVTAGRTLYWSEETGWVVQPTASLTHEDITDFDAGVRTNRLDQLADAEGPLALSYATPTISLTDTNGAGDLDAEWAMLVDWNSGDPYLTFRCAGAGFGSGGDALQLAKDASNTGRAGLFNDFATDAIFVISANLSSASSDGIRFTISNVSDAGTSVFCADHESTGSENMKGFEIANSGTSSWYATYGGHTAQDGNATIGGFLELGGASPTALTIASGVVTATSTWHIIDTEGGAATDDLDTINGGGDGRLLILVSASPGRDVTVKSGTGNITLTGGDYTFANHNSVLVLFYKAAAWRELIRA